MRQDLVDAPERDAADHEPDQRRNQSAADELDCRFEQAPEANGEHDAGGKAHHAVEELAVELPGEKDAGRTQRGDCPGEGSGQKRLQDRVQRREPAGHQPIAEVALAGDSEPRQTRRPCRRSGRTRCPVAGWPRSPAKSRRGNRCPCRAGCGRYSRRPSHKTGQPY